MDTHYQYLIVGAGLAGASAVEGIRERDPAGSILLIGAESELPYDRPPLSKKLWFGKKKLEEIFLHDRAWYESKGVELQLGTRVVGLDRANKAVVCEREQRWRYDRLLLATGGSPRRLRIPGGDASGLCYYRTIEDYRRMREQSGPGRSAVVIGGGFIGSELAAGLAVTGTAVTMVFPEVCPCQRVLPDALGRSLLQLYRDKGVRVLPGDVPVSLEKRGERFTTLTRAGARLESDVVLVGIGIQPGAQLAADARLTVGDGIVVNALLQTSDPDIYAAGDNAFFPYQALGKSMRVEHWDNALAQGNQAGQNMAGAYERYTHLPYFFSDLFEFGYEAVGEVDSRLETFADWKEENRTGAIYYLDHGKVRGVMLCNVWGKVDEARRLIREGAAGSPERLRGVI
ncbi:MAG: NAD(P)/FAD-dependent oxidoreductase, partial [Myxococcaceae bacterium]